MTTRREFIGQCALAAIAVSLPSILFTSCANIPVYKTSSSASAIEVPMTLFSQSNLVKVRPTDSEFDILVVKDNNSYKALLLECTHQGFALNVSSTELSCPAHGSLFDLDGDVTKGPATSSLKTYSVTTQNNQLIINLKS